MALPSSGSITLAQVATELGVSLPLDLNAANVRALAGVASGPITLPNDLWGKSSYDGTVDGGDLGSVYGNDYFNGGVSAQSLTTWTVSGLSSGAVVTLRFTTVNVAISAYGGFGGSSGGANGNGGVGVERISGPSGYGSGSANYNTNQSPVSKTFDITVQNGDVLRMYANGSAFAYDFGQSSSGDFSGSLSVTNLSVGQGEVASGDWNLTYSSNGELG